MDAQRRLFLAYPLEEGETATVVEFQSKARSVLTKLGPLRSIVRSISSQDFHVTLRFLGKTPVDKQKELALALSELRLPPGLQMNWTQWTPFPDLERIQVLSVEDPKPPPELIDFQSKLEKLVTRFGFPSEERNYRPHLTLFRFRKPISVKLDTLPVPKGSIKLTSFCLYESRSRLGPGSRYVRLQTY